MAAEQRLSITGNPNESLSSRYFPGDSESPTIGQLHALVKVANGMTIPEDIKQATLDTAIRFREHLEKVIDKWNSDIQLGLGEYEYTRIIGFNLLCDSMALSYGSELISPISRKILIHRAVKAAEATPNFSRN